ncbi:hypothetical protein F5Y16DRAFT_108710 [Xylariaceae sp. FL0255]|nr:hypothetical protein F5Y16DRAFT_108710 [Xylariaceae sp. FL0255]
MFSHSRQPENAACAARVSEDLPLLPVSPNPSASAANKHLPSASPRPTDAASDSVGTVHVAVPSASESSVTTTLSPLPLSSSAANAAAPHGAQDNNKRPRPPLPLSRSTGPSLLTQALASARGIPSSNNPSIPDQRRPDLHDQLRPDSLKDVSNGLQELTLAEPRLDSSGQSQSGPSIPGTTNTLPAPSERELPVVMPGLTETTSTQVRADRPGSYAFTRMRGRSLGRTEKEARIHLFSGTALPSADNVGDTSFRRVDTSFSPNQPPQEMTDNRAQYHSWRTGEKVSIGPEKVWSIGTDSTVGHQDGQVEKSITEALAGLEPTRSRKASHSLRFFKEGLPIDNAKRRDSKPTPQRERTVGSHEVTHIKTPSTTLSQDTNLSLLNKTSLPSSAIARNPLEVTDELGYFSLEAESYPDSGHGHIRDRHEDQSPASVSHRNQSAVHDQETVQSPSKSRGESQFTEFETAIEESEESSEEKISSAVFVPHPGLEGSDQHTAFSEKPESVSRRPSTKDFHPWLVKADEPEVEGDCSCNSNQPEIAISSIDGIPCGRELTGQKSHDYAVRDDTKSQVNSHDVSVKTSRPLSQYYEDVVHDHQLAPKVPLEAIELIPYKHQVGGHTTIWRFSKRAVCKQLNNRENEFYENIERYHRDLLPFLPRYIGVLNVTYQKQPRRKSTIRKEEGFDTGGVLEDSAAQPNGKNGTTVGKRSLSDGRDDENHRRIVSQSLQSGHIPIPTVTFVDNQHILPRSLLQPAGYSGLKERPKSASAATTRENDMFMPSSNDSLPQTNRPSLDDRHANSWGATTVNKKLRNEVFNDAFLKRPIAVHKHQTPASHHRSVPRRSVQPRSAESIAAFPTSEIPSDRVSPPNETRFPRYPASLLLTQSDIGPKSIEAGGRGKDDVKDVTGTSAPEPDTLGEKFSAQVRKRRYSGSKLRRKPEDVRESRGELKYFEDADDVGYRGDGESDVFSPLGDGRKDEQELASKFTDHNGQIISRTPESQTPLLTPTASDPVVEVPRPVNPKEAQTQRDSRVEFFLLLEDLTAGMKRPCVMDLKMGTRQYGVFAGPKKRDSQRRKCAETTSRELGVRVCGLQTWDAKSQSYIFRDKYYGRNLKAGREFRDTLTMFLYDGVDYESVLRHIPVILQKLNQLETTVLRLRGYRFYAASLLIFYDAGAPSSSSDTAAEDSTTDFATDTEDTWDIKRRRRNRGEIDIKIADFANSVTAGDPMGNKPCPPQHQDEPDRGFLRGLSTLRKCFLRIQRDIRSEMGFIPLRKMEAAQGLEDEYEGFSISE